ncbi:putative zinc finger CCHC domain-containing protein [Zea mays]|uniref:Putative zinc finger CCHC domain-containing protein n=1 Tax=Zea mays TaxID=4577 RepID=A0A3L6EUW3_MAIZE|nr:putative zinc finger CCHC domain-containing protein [Zea mays]
MEEEVTGSGGGIGRKMAAGEVDLKEKSGTAWSHSYLNQKPWHPLSYPNQRRKWIAEQVHANHARRQEEVQREFAQEQEFFRQTALFSKKDKEKMEVMKAVSFMYVRPPGYNAESAKAAEIEDEKKRSDPGDMGTASASTSSIPDKGPEKAKSGADKKNRPKDVFGRPLATEQEFEVLKNAPRLDTGAPARVKPFGVEVRNVRCLRCGNYGHQSGDRECPLKDAIMPNEESRLKRDDPLTTIMAQTDSSEPLKWELKQKPGMSPPRGGFDPDDPNQQIVAEDIFDEYGGFLGNCDIPALISNFSATKSKKRSKKKSKHKQAKSAIHEDSSRHESSYHLSSDFDNEKRNITSRSKRKKANCSDSSYSDSEIDARKGKSKSKHKHTKKYQLESSDSEFDVREDTRRRLKRDHMKEKRDESPLPFSKDQGDTEGKRHSRCSREKHNYSYSSSSSERGRRRSREKRHYSYSPSSSERGRHSLRHKEKQYYSDSSSDRSHRHSRRSREKRHDRDSSPPDAIRRSSRSTEKQRRPDTSPRHANGHSKKSSGKQDYTERSRYETSRHSRRSQEKRHYPDSSASDYSDSDQHKKHRHHHRRK